MLVVQDRRACIRFRDWKRFSSERCHIDTSHSRGVVVRNYMPHTFLKSLGYIGQEMLAQGWLKLLIFFHSAISRYVAGCYS